MRGRVRCRAAVTSVVLLALAGGLWLGVGSMLLILAASWLLDAASVSGYGFAGAGVGLALLVHHFGFKKIAEKNIARIRAGEGKRCMLSFMPWKSYLIIPLMMTMGAILRHSTIPKPYVAVLYTTIGLALVLSSMRYARVIVKEPRAGEGEES